MQTTTKSSNLFDQDSYLMRIRPWCLGSTYDYCPLMIIILIFVIIVCSILITILCIHNRKPYITQSLISSLINRKNRLLQFIFCKKQQSELNTGVHSTRHSAIHNSIFWVNNNVTNQNRPAPPPYDDNNTLPTTVTTCSNSSGYSSCNINNGFNVEEALYIVNPVRQYLESAVDTVDLTDPHYYANRRYNRKNLSFMSTDSFQFIQSPARNYGSSAVSIHMLPQASFQSSSTLRSECNEQPPSYEAVAESFKKVNDCDNLVKFKRLQQKYQQSVGQSRREYYKQKYAIHPANRQSTATILSESEIIV